MHSNAERVIATRTKLRDPGKRQVLFKNEVERLFNILDGLHGQTMSQSSSSELFKVHLRGPRRGRRRIHGWEYMRLVDHPNHRDFDPKCVYLGSSSGLWSEYAKDANALVLFASGFGDIVQPVVPTDLCARCLSLPKDQDFLIIRVDTLETLFNQQGCSEDRARLTNNGWTLQAVDDPFRRCEDANTQPGPRGVGEHYGGSDHHRLVQLARKVSRNKLPFTHQLPPTGAIVIGDPGPNSLRKGGQKEDQGEEDVSVPLKCPGVAVNDSSPALCGVAAAAAAVAAAVVDSHSRMVNQDTEMPSPRQKPRLLKAPSLDKLRSTFSLPFQQSVLSSATNMSSDATSMVTDEGLFVLELQSRRKRLPRPMEKAMMGSMLMTRRASRCE